MKERRNAYERNIVETFYHLNLMSQSGYVEHYIQHT